MHFHDVVGTLGVLFIVGTYLLLTLEKIRSEDLIYSLLNACGAALILFSLYFKPNISAATVEFFWLVISLYGAWKSIRRAKV